MDLITRKQAIDALAAKWTPEALAAAIVDALTPAGANDEWDSETVEFVLAPLMDISRPLGWPVNFNGFDDETAFWQHVESHTR